MNVKDCRLLPEFTIRWKGGFKTREAAEEWAKRRSNERTMQTFVTWSPITKDWGAELHS